MKTVVTGATGHIGTALMRELQARGEAACAFVLPNEDVSHIAAWCKEIVRGYVLYAQSLERAFEGANNVFHLAGIISIGSENKKLVTAVNVQGTHNVVSAAKAAGVKNLVYTGSVHAIPVEKKRKMMTEPHRFDSRKVRGHYAKTKAEAINIVIDANCEQLRTVVGLPSGVVGPYAYQESNIGAMISALASGSLRAFLNGGYDYVDARDVAFALAELMRCGAGGESYILSGEALPVKNMVEIICHELRIKPPRICLPAWLAKAVSPFAELHYLATKQKPVFTRYSLYTVTSNHNFSHLKAEKLFGFRPRALTDALRDEIEFMRGKLGLSPKPHLLLKGAKQVNE